MKIQSIFELTGIVTNLVAVEIIVKKKISTGTEKWLAECIPDRELHQKTTCKPLSENGDKILDDSISTLRDAL